MNSSAFVLTFAALSLLSFTARAEQKWDVPVSANRKVNPLGNRWSAVSAGMKLFNSNCVSCHGNEGMGNGPVAAALNPKPADFSEANVRTQSDGALFWKISEGHGPMMSWKRALTETQRWQLVSYIRVLAPW